MTTPTTTLATWTHQARRLAAAPHVAAWAVAALTVAAGGEAAARGTVDLVRGDASPIALPSALFLALCTTVPLGFLAAPGAAVAVSAAAALSLAGTRSLTVAGAAAVVLALYRLGWAAASDDAPRSGSTSASTSTSTSTSTSASTSASASASVSNPAQSSVRRQATPRRGPPPPTRRRLSLLPVFLALPFPIIALSGSPASEEGVLAVALTALAAAAAFAGRADRSSAQARIHSAAREAVARSLVEHTARGERARIARELHDVVAHHISMIAVQAETARLATPGLPAVGAERLLAIGDTARAGLTEMRRLLGVLREDASAVAALEERHPQPGLDQLIGLLDEARATSGSTTRLIVSGPPAALDPGVELAAYRIVQEALTNVRRHAPGAAVDVELRFAPDSVLLRVRDNGPGPAVASDSAGHGLSGMRERAAAAGGELHTGPAPGGGFLVEAVLPAVPAPDSRHAASPPGQAAMAAPDHATATSLPEAS